MYSDEGSANSKDTGESCRLQPIVIRYVPFWYNSMTDNCSRGRICADETRLLTPTERDVDFFGLVHAWGDPQGLGPTVDRVPVIPTGRPRDVSVHVDDGHDQEVHGIGYDHIVTDCHQSRNDHGCKSNPCRTPTKRKIEKCL